MNSPLVVKCVQKRMTPVVRNAPVDVKDLFHAIRIGKGKALFAQSQQLYLHVYIRKTDRQARPPRRRHVCGSLGHLSRENRTRTPVGDGSFGNHCTSSCQVWPPACMPCGPPTIRELTFCRSPACARVFPFLLLLAASVHYSTESTRLSCQQLTRKKKMKIKLCLYT